MSSYYFTVVPTVPKPVGYDRFWSRFNYQEGQALVVAGGVYRLSQFPQDEELAAADSFYLGGHIYIVDGDTADALIAHGYRDGLSVITDDNGDPIDPLPDLGYGEGPYGEGPYGD